MSNPVRLRAATLAGSLHLYISNAREIYTKRGGAVRLIAGMGDPIMIEQIVMHLRQ